MPLYNTQCNDCGLTETRKLTYDEYDTVTEGSTPLHCVCGGTPGILFDPSAVSFVLRDGPSGGWATKAALENRYRRDRHATMGRRERDHVKPNKLVPNFGGEIAHSWSEAKGAAYQSTYDKVNGEHGARTAAKVAQESARTFDKHIKQEAK